MRTYEYARFPHLNPERRFGVLATIRGDVMLCTVTFVRFDDVEERFAASKDGDFFDRVDCALLSYNGLVKNASVFAKIRPVLENK